MLKKLPITYPLVNCYPSSSDAVAILQSYTNIYPWLLNNFIQLFEVKKNVLDFFDFALENNPFLMYNEIHYSLLLGKWSKMSEFIIDAIDKNYYVKIFVNISKISLYNTNDVVYHDIMIYGYDKISNVFYVADHFVGRKYSFEICSFEEIDSSYDLIDKGIPDDLINKEIPNDLEHVRFVQLIKPDMNTIIHRYDFASSKEREYMCSFNITNVEYSINDYLNCVPSKHCFTRYPAMDLELSKNHNLGMNCYNVINRHIENLEKNGEVQPFAIHSFYVEYNHKKIMVERLRYMMEKNMIKNAKEHICKYEKIMNESNTMLFLFGKLCLQSNKKRGFDKIKNMCNTIKIDEEIELINILDDIKHS